MTQGSPSRPLSPWTVRVLLLGWAAPLPKGTARVSALPAEAQSEIAALWAGGTKAIVKAWKLHREWLLKEAERLQIPAIWSRGDRRIYFGEFVSTGGTPGKERT